MVDEAAAYGGQQRQRQRNRAGTTPDVGGPDLDATPRPALNNILRRIFSREVVLGIGGYRKKGTAVPGYRKRKRVAGMMF